MADLLSFQVNVPLRKTDDGRLLEEDTGYEFERKRRGVSLKKVDNANADHSNRLSYLAPKQAVDIEFQNLTYSVEEERKRGYKTILKCISGKFVHGQLTAVMGPSGAGKSSLLNILAAYRIKNVVGDIQVNGVERDLKKFRKTSCYIMQTDHLLRGLSVMESMTYSADLRLPQKMKECQRKQVVHQILEALGLWECRNTRMENLSGGQRKRLSIALELIINPPIMFFDEPTSGLDSQTCLQCIQLLKALAQGGRTIVCTIHQPSAKIFEMFDHLYMLAGGECIYNGSIQDVVPYLGSLGLVCPPYHNPADYVMEIAVGEYGEHLSRLSQAVRRGHYENVYTKRAPPNTQVMMGGIGDEKEGAMPGKPSWATDQCQSLTNGAVINNLTGKAEREVTVVTKDGEEEEGMKNLFATTGWHQFRILFIRSFKCILRDSQLTKIRVLMMIGVGILLGMVYKGIGDNSRRVYNNIGCITFTFYFVAISALMPTVQTFPIEMMIIVKEHLNYWYSLRSYYLSRSMADLPFQIILPVVTCTIVYWMSDQPQEAGRFFKYLLLGVLVGLMSQTIGLIVGGLSADIEAATFIGPASTFPVFLLGGFFINFNVMPKYVRWITYSSYGRYVYEAVLESLYDNGREKMTCREKPEDKIYCQFEDGESFLQELELTEVNYARNIGIICAFLVVLRIAGFFALKWKVRNH